MGGDSYGDGSKIRNLSKETGEGRVTYLKAKRRRKKKKGLLKKKKGVWRSIPRGGRLVKQGKNAVSLDGNKGEEKKIAEDPLGWRRVRPFGLSENFKPKKRGTVNR